MAVITPENSKTDASRPAYRVAIIGCGPRGLYAMESLLQAVASLPKPTLVSITVFEPHRAPGAGPNYSPDQSDLNLLNIPHRDIDLGGRAEIQLGNVNVPAFATFNEWLSREGQAHADADAFHPRNLMGQYLHARFACVAAALDESGIFQLVRQTVTEFSVVNGEYRIGDGLNYCEFFDEVLLTIGHQSLELDKQLVAWKRHGENNRARLWIDPYPTRQITKSTAITAESTVALRGFGLTMIDVVRALTEGRGGIFCALDDGRLNYERSGREPRCLVPFSLDGLPLAPKPATHEIDSLYQPEHEAKAEFRVRLQVVIAMNPDETCQALWQHFAALVQTLWHRHYPANTVFSPDVIDSLNQWRDDQTLASPHFLSPELAPEQIMQSYLEMAQGKRPPTLDYCAGQVWRHVQEEIYRVLSHSSIESCVMREVMELDESMKRFSYGPPSEQIMRLLALVDCALLRFHVVDDPDINALQAGWSLRDEPDAIMASVMINTVIPSPVLQQVASPLVKAMVRSNLLVSYADGMGASTDAEGHSVEAVNESIRGLSLLGRLAAGSVMGSDSIHDCFSQETTRWASAVARRATRALMNQQN